MIVATPLALQPLVPSDWNRWWDIWNTHGAQLKKTRGNHNSMSGLHFGFDIFRHERAVTDYEAAQVNMQQMWPEFFDQVMSTLPVQPLVIRFVMSTGDFPAHTDNVFRNWQLRSMFYHPDPEPQWYFTKLDGTDKQFLRLPVETNWFAYLDGACKHGTHYVADKPKILLQVFSRSYEARKFVEEQLHLPELEQYRIAY